MPKGLNNISSLRDIKGMSSILKRAPSFEYTGLDLYMLAKEKERLTKEDRRVNRQKAEIQKRLNDIKGKMETLRLCLFTKEDATLKEQPQKKEWTKDETELLKT